MFFDATLPNSDERTAAHETGHVLAAYFLGFPFVYVTIDADERYPGAAGHVAHNITAVHSRITAAEDPWRPGGYWAHTATTVAGRLGECKVFGNYGNGAEEDDGAADLAVRSQVFDPEDYELCHMQVLDLAGEVIFNAALSPASTPSEQRSKKRAGLITPQSSPLSKSMRRQPSSLPLREVSRYDQHPRWRPLGRSSGLATVTQQARDYAAQAAAPNTQRAHRADWQISRPGVTRAAWRPCRAATETVGLYVTDLAQLGHRPTHRAPRLHHLQAPRRPATRRPPGTPACARSWPASGPARPRAGGRYPVWLQPATCPVRALRAWRAAAGVPDGPVCSASSDRWGHIAAERLGTGRSRGPSSGPPQRPASTRPTTPPIACGPAWPPAWRPPASASAPSWRRPATSP